MVDASAVLAPFFEDRLGHRALAANQFLDYAEQHRQTNVKNATLALENAQTIIGQLRSDPQTRQDAAVTSAYERFLPIAIAAPFNRVEFAFEYAARLQLNGKPKDAVDYFRLVPDNDKRAPEARYRELVANKQQLDEQSAGGAERTQAVNELMKMAQRVTELLQGALTTAKTEPERANFKSMLAGTAIVGADLARRELKDPQQALTLLASLEQTVQGLPNSDNLINEAMYIRVQSYMAAGNYTEATGELVKLLNKTEGAHGAQIVYNLLEKLNADFDRAQQANDTAAMKTLARNRAELSGFLVKWAAGNSDPGIRKYTYRYRVFDAETQYRAAVLEDDAPTRQQGLKQALARYLALESADNLALYRASMDSKSPAAADPDLYDPQVTFGIASVNYELGDFEQASARFSKLLTQRRLGDAMITVSENGQEKTIDNDQYWEAILRLIQCNLKLGHGMAESKDFLNRQYIIWGSHVGGKKWKAEYEAIRKQLLPEITAQ
jgi:hypothetical protein